MRDPKIGEVYYYTFLSTPSNPEIIEVTLVEEDTVYYKVLEHSTDTKRGKTRRLGGGIRIGIFNRHIKHIPAYYSPLYKILND